jgi:hypothetical protein
VDFAFDPALYHVYDPKGEPPTECAEPKQLFLNVKRGQAACLRGEP